MRLCHLAALACLLVPVLGLGQGPTSTYRFQSNFVDSQHALPDLTPVDPLLLNTFPIELVFGATRRVYACSGTPGDGTNAGLQIDLRPFFSTEYSIEFVASIANVQGWSKLIDNQGLNSDLGLYAFQGHLDLYPLGNGPDTILPNVYYHVVLTQDMWNNVTVYVNGVQQFTFNDTALNLTGVTSLFIDDAVTHSEYTTAKIALLRLYNYPMNPGEVALAATDPFRDGFFIQPNAYWLHDGYELQGDLTSLYSSDDSSLVIFPDENSPFSGEVVLRGTSPVLNPHALRFSIETSVGRQYLVQIIRLYNYDSGTWEELDGRFAPTQDFLISKFVTGDPGRFVSNTGEMLATVAWLIINDEDTSQDGWPESIDIVRWTVKP